MFRAKFLFLSCLLLTPTLLLAQREGIEGEEEGDEAYQIEQRIEWFERSHSLEQVNRPDLRRRQAALETRDQRRREANRPFRAAWTEIGPSPMNMLSWTMGRVSGRVTALAVHPSDINTLYLGTADGGLWKTTDAGASWVPLTMDLGTQSIGALLIDPNDSETLWVGTGEHTQGCTGYFGIGLYRSTDGGATLDEMNGSSGHMLDLSYISAIAKHPSAANVVLVGGRGFCSGGSLVTGGVYRSADGGLTWDRTLTGEAHDIVSDPTDANVFYAGIGRSSNTVNGVYKTSNGGQTWTRLENGIDFGSSLTRFRIAMAPSNHDIVYVYTQEGKIFKTTNGGTSWTQTGSGACEGQCSYNLCFAVNPANPSNLLIGSIRHGISTNEGSSISYLTTTWGSAQKVHQDTHVLVYDPNDGNRFWVGTDGGLWRSDNGGTTYTNLNGNLNITQFYDIAVNPSDHTRVFGGAQDNSSLGTSNNLVWDVNLVSGDGFMNLVDPLDPNIVIQTSYPQGSMPSLYRSTTGGGPNTFSFLSSSGLLSGPFPWVTPLEICTNSAQTTSYMFVGSNRVFMSANHGTTWTQTSTGTLGSASLSVIEAAPVDSRIVVYAGSSDGNIYRTDNALDATPTWTNVKGNYPGGNITDIAVDPADTNRVFITRGAFGASRLYYSTTGGTTWTAIGGGLSDVPANAVAIDPVDNDRIFVGTDVGVFESTDGGTTFNSMMLGFPLATVVTDLEISETPHVLTAGTYGRGAWRIDLAIGDLAVEASPDQEACLGDGAQLKSTVSNGVEPLTYVWSVTSGPDTSAAQFDSTSAANPTFTATAEGTYSIKCQVTDGLSRSSEDDTVLAVSSQESYSDNQRSHWSTTPTSPDWQTRYDRNSNNLVEILDLLLQLATPTCY